MADIIKVAPDGGYGWVIVGAATVTTSLITIPAVLIGILFNYIMDNMSASATQIATMASLLSCVSNFCGPFSASYTQRTSCRRGVIIGGFITAFAIFSSAWVKSIQLLTFTFGLLLGVGNSFTVNSSLFLINDYFVKRRGLAIGIRTTGFSMGRAIFPMFLQYLMFEYGFQGVMLLSSSLLLHICVCGALFQPVDRHLVIKKIDKALVPLKSTINNEETVTKIQNKDPGDKEKVAEGTTTPTVPIWRKVYKILLGQMNFSIMKKPIFYLLLLNYLANSFIIFFAILFLYPYAISKGLDKIQATYVMSAFGISDVIGRLLITSLMDVPRLGAKAINIFTCFSTATVLLFMTLTNTLTTVVATACFLGFFVGGQLSGFLVLCTIQVGTKNVPTVMGLSQFFQAFVLLSFGPLLGKIRDVTGGFTGCYYVLAAFSYLSVLAWAIEIWIGKRKAAGNAQNVENNVKWNHSTLKQ